MFEVVSKERLNEQVTRLGIQAPLIARKALAGQFVIFRLGEFGERVPLTIADTNDSGVVFVVFQAVGEATQKLAALKVGDEITDFVGPLGRPCELEGAKRAIVIGGGVGNAIAYPATKALHQQGATVDVIAGFRNEELVIMCEEYAKVCDRFHLVTDDGSVGEKGFVTTKLQSLLDTMPDRPDLILAIGPVPMMKAVAALTKPYGIKTLVSLNPIMIDGTGMCGGCRVNVGGEVKFACVDGPEFDGHLVDFDDLQKRNSFYKNR